MPEKIKRLQKVIWYQCDHCGGNTVHSKSNGCVHDHGCVLCGLIHRLDRAYPRVVDILDEGNVLEGLKHG